MSGRKHANLNERQVRLLRAILPDPGASPTDLAKALSVPLPFVSTTSRRMVALGFVRRQHDPADLRKVLLCRLLPGDEYLARLDCLTVRAPTAAELDAGL